MDLQMLQECELIQELEEKGANIEFKTYIYSTSSMQMEEIVVSCPMSGNYILTELAKIVSGSVDSKNEKMFLVQLFSSLEDNIKLKNALKKSPISSTGVGSIIKKSIESFLQESEEEKTLEKKELLKFDFLRICSGAFDEIYSNYIENNGS
jgi:hypothetical protein